MLHAGGEWGKSNCSFKLTVLSTLRVEILPSNGVVDGKNGLLLDLCAAVHVELHGIYSFDGKVRCCLASVTTSLTSTDDLLASVVVLIYY